VHSPAGGLGLNTGIQDAYNLGWKLATPTPTLLLVRPDNYIGCATVPSDVEAITAYLKRISPARVTA
jgi:hypothetical protein